MKRFDDLFDVSELKWINNLQRKKLNISFVIVVNRNFE